MENNQIDLENTQAEAENNQIDLESTQEEAENVQIDPEDTQSEAENPQPEEKVKKSHKKLWVTLGIIFGSLAVIALLVILLWSNIKVMFTVLKLRNAEIGETFTMGTYEQDGNLSTPPEDIEWVVLAKEGDKVLVISKYALDCVPYNEEFDSATWETCTLRTWLNKDFYNSVFNKAESKVIPVTTVTADPNPTYKTNAGNDTQDKIFLLSIAEAEKYANQETLKCLPTEYTVKGRVVIDEETKCCSWWLRTPGYLPQDATAVGGQGFIYGQGNYVYFPFYAVRPAMWIDIG